MDRGGASTALGDWLRVWFRLPGVLTRVRMPGAQVGMLRDTARPPYGDNDYQYREVIVTGTHACTNNPDSVPVLCTACRCIETMFLRV